MGSEGYPLRNVGIYRNLPSFDPSLTGLKAIICGATGISGFNTLRALLSDTNRWSKIYLLSRSPLKEEAAALLTPEERARTQHISVDLTSSATDISKTLKDANASADYVFFYSYLQPKTEKGPMHPDTADALRETNVPIFRNFIDALPLANIKPKRILLQTGGKNYGCHIGRGRTPLVESDPQPKHLQDNFYYHQEQALFDYCEAHPETKWNIVMPMGVIGAVPSAAMNMMLPLGAYAAVQAHKGQALEFPGDFAGWQYELTHSTARMTGYLSEWAVLEEKCANQRFNAQDGCPVSWDRLWGEMARWYGAKGARGPEEDESKYQTMEMAGGKEAPLGYGPPPAVRISYSLQGWAEKSDNKRAWEEMMKKSEGKLRLDMFADPSGPFQFVEFSTAPLGQASGAKARRFGFCGFVDTIEGTFETFQDFEKLGMLPAMKVNEATPLM